MKRNAALTMATVLALWPLYAGPARADEQTELLELRNTVVNLLQALVERGIMTREQAEAMVSAAQDRAAEEAQALAAKEAAEQDAVRVTYVPQIVKDDIARAVREEVRPLVVNDMIEHARDQQWGVADALPEWTRRVSLYGDVRVRGVGVQYGSDNAIGTYLNFQRINEAGGIGLAGPEALLNTSEDRAALQGRVRFGVRAAVSDHLTGFVQLASGSAGVPVSTNQTLGNYNRRWTTTIDRAGLYWNSSAEDRRHGFEGWAGRFENPFLSFTPNELIWDADLALEGLAMRYSLDLGSSRGDRVEPNVFFAAGAFPLQELELSSDDKWMYGAQLGSMVRIGDSGRLRAAVTWYQYENIVGIRNAPDSTLLDYTAPEFLQKGNTLFDIRNDLDPATNLFALAADYHLLNAHLSLEVPLSDLIVQTWADYVRNEGFDSKDVMERTGLSVDPRIEGYELGVGLMSGSQWPSAGGWRSHLVYRYLQRDAVLDAFSDSDFHLGGTDATGWTLSFDFAFAQRAWLRLRYLTANEIDGPPLAIDTLFLELNGSF